MDIIIIGSGNVATHLARAFTQNNIPIKQIFGRNESDLKQILKENNIPYSTEKLGNADFYLIATSDTAIEDISKKIINPNALVAHTSGSLPKEILQGNYRKASFYPLQTFSKTKSLIYDKIPFFIDAEREDDEAFLKQLAQKISPNVMKVSYEMRKYIHLTAVFSCNFVNHLWARAKEISDSQNIPFQYFYPLISETLEKIQFLDPKNAQTGPAVRNDKRVLELHETLITNEEQLKIYKTLNESIQKMYELD